MKFTYAYKTSDGVRHEDSIEAKSRDEVFATLRGRGIRAIKVFAADGSKANGEMRGVRKRVLFAAAVFAAVVAGSAVYWLKPYQQQPDRISEARRLINFTSETSRIAYTNLEAQASILILHHESRMASLNLDRLTDYRRISAMSNTTSLEVSVTAGYKTINASRSAVRDLFKGIFELFPSDCETERLEAQRLYAETMDAIDISEGNLANDEKAFRLLVANRDSWHCANGRVVWTDAVLANEFAYLSRNQVTEISRTTIESPVVRIPSASAVQTQTEHRASGP